MLYLQICVSCAFVLFFLHDRQKGIAPVEFYVEGLRSRTLKSLVPKLGECDVFTWSMLAFVHLFPLLEPDMKSN